MEAVCNAAICLAVGRAGLPIATQLACALAFVESIRHALQTNFSPPFPPLKTTFTGRGGGGGVEGGGGAGGGAGTGAPSFS